MTVRLPSFSKTQCPNLRKITESPGLVLASGSPRRKTILTEIGLRFDIQISNIEEKHDAYLPSGELATDLARQKAMAVSHDGERVYLGCDTIVVFDGQLLNKPTDEKDALRILITLAGNTHSVFTGMALYDSRSNNYLSGCEESRVTFNSWDTDRLKEYISTGEPMDKAGAYGIQGMGRFLVDTVEGNIDNVIGLPLGILETLARKYWEMYV
ncbi:MAG: septum formation protein Maf [candidate division Zixibacteria bacterium]|nr:septum formation protein Maf [candidate division Zixibacteria bacterium]